MVRLLTALAALILFTAQAAAESTGAGGAAEAALKAAPWGRGQIALWLVIELHFLAIMVLAGSSLLAFAMDGVGAMLGHRLSIGDGLWKNLYSRLSVMFSMLGLAGLGVAGLFPSAAQTWLGVFAPSFGTHAYFGLLGLAGGYGVLSCRVSEDEGAYFPRANAALFGIVLLLLLGFGSLMVSGRMTPAALATGLVVFVGPAGLIVLFRSRQRIGALRLTCEAISALAFMVLVSVASSWRGTRLEQSSLVDLLSTLTLRRPFYHGVASICLVSLLELAWGKIGRSGGGALGREVRRAGGDNRWFLLAAILSLMLLPFMGYLGSPEAAEGSWLLAFQGGLAAVTLLALNHELWHRIERIGGPGVKRTWLWALIFLGATLILVTPGRLPLSPSEQLALNGAELVPGYVLWGSAPVKHAAFALLGMVSFDAALAMVRGEISIAPMSRKRQATVQAIVWGLGGVSVVILTLGFGALRGNASEGSAWDMMSALLLDADVEARVAAAEQTRGPAYEALGIAALPPEPVGEARRTRLAASRLGDIPAVRRAWAWRDARPREELDRAEALDETPLDALGWEAIWFEARAPGHPSRAVQRHAAAVKTALRSRRDARRLEALGLPPATRALLLLPLLLLSGLAGVIIVACWLESRDQGKAGRGLVMATGWAGLIGLLLWSHSLPLGNAALAERLYGADQVLMLALLVFVGGSHLARMVCSPRLEVHADLCQEGLNPTAEGLHKVEVVAALGFVFALALGGWAQSGAALSSLAQPAWGDVGGPLLRLVTSRDGSALGSAVKSTLIVGLGLVLFLGATRFFVWATHVGEEESEARGVTWREMAPVGMLLVLLLAYLDLEGRWLSGLFGVVLLGIVLARQDWREVPLLAVFFAFAFLMLGVECAGLDVVRRSPLVRAPPPAQAPVGAAREAVKEPGDGEAEQPPGGR